MNSSKPTPQNPGHIKVSSKLWADPRSGELVSTAARQISLHSYNPLLGFALSCSMILN
jgi:hypothetical protein